MAVHFALVLVQILFASLAIFGKVVLKEIPPLLLVTFRVTGAAAVLVAALRLNGRTMVTDRSALRRFLFLGIIGIVANQGLFLLGLRYTTAINATILVATIPVFTVLNGILFHREPASSFKLGGIALAMAGSVWLIGPDRLTLAPETAIGNLLILLGMYAYAHYLALVKPMTAKYGSLATSAHVMSAAAIAVLPVGFWSAGQTDFAAVRPTTWLLTGYIVLGPTLGTYFLNTWALKRASPNLVAVYVYLQPVLTALVAPLILTGEAVTPRAALAGLLIFLGVALVILGERRQRRELAADPVPPE